MAVTNVCAFWPCRYGVVDAIKLHRDKDTGKSKGFAFLRYEDPRSCVLAVDNFNGTNILNRKVSVNHVKDYKNAEEMDIVAEQGEGEGSEDEKTKRDRRRKEKKTEARSVELMRAAMSQDSEEKQRAIDKERRRDERRRRERSHDERRDEEISHHQKMPKYETYESDMPHSYRDH